MQQRPADRPRLRALTFLIVFALSGSVQAQETSRAGFLGDSGCLACHQVEGTKYRQTAHHLTSQRPDEGAVLGSFAKGTNTLTIKPIGSQQEPPGLMFRMERHGGHNYESAITGYEDDVQQRTESIDLVTGSGKRGQTYLFWSEDRLFELPVSFWTAGRRWVNSPGFVLGTADFARPILPGCLECHASYLEPLSSTSAAANRYLRASFEPGIGCETCHGPGAEHAAFHKASSSPDNRPIRDPIVNPAKLTRERQVELCALCHNGTRREALQPPFSYRPGEPLANFYKALPGEDAEHPDVHGQQVALLERSRCFQGAKEMTCSTCHNTHAPERSAASYSAKCLTCHAWTACPTAHRMGDAAKVQCVRCHMPLETTRSIISQMPGGDLHTSMRNHWIKVYEESAIPAR